MDNQERWYLENLPLSGAVVADVGANVGRLSQFFWEHVGSGRVVSIEPEPENVRELERRIQAAGANNWSVEPCAVSDRDGTVLTRAFDVPFGKNSTVVAKAGDGVLEVPCRRLEDLVPDATVIKLDIEGHEYQVLPTAVPALTQARVWALELHSVEGHRLQDTLARFTDLGYRLLAAAQKKTDPEGAWVNVPVSAKLSWTQIPGTPAHIDGVPGIYKMLHVLAVR